MFTIFDRLESLLLSFLGEIHYKAPNDVNHRIDYDFILPIATQAHIMHLISANASDWGFSERMPRHPSGDLIQSLRPADMN
jgi:hypothetical protein